MRGIRALSRIWKIKHWSDTNTLLLPGRSQYTALTQQVNEKLEALCEEKDYMYFVDASEITFA